MKIEVEIPDASICNNCPLLQWESGGGYCRYVDQPVYWKDRKYGLAIAKHPDCPALKKEDKQCKQYST